MEGCYGQHGWKQFHRNRKDILHEFDKIYELLEDRPIKTAHGDGVEAYLRKWLSEFLPKKYAVTSGYIIPDLYDESPKIYHYDIIIYQALEAPILWAEGNYDNSDQGKYLAIPAKHVVAVYEVKSRFTKKTIRDSIKKLKEVNSFNEQFPDNYHSGVIYIDLKEADVNKGSFLKELYRGNEAYGFIGGMVLRYESDITSTGLISLNQTNDDDCTNTDSFPLARKINELNIFVQENGQLVIDDVNGAGATLETIPDIARPGKLGWAVSKMYSSYYIMNKLALDLSWSRSNFSKFCIRLINLIDGNNDSKKNFSFGKIFDPIEVKKMKEQDDIFHPGRPFIELNVHSKNNNGTPIVEYNNNHVKVNFTTSMKNLGSSTVTISDDDFKNTHSLAPSRKVERTISLLINIDDGRSVEDMKEDVASNKVILNYGIVYYEDSAKSDLIQVKKKIKISDNEIEAFN